MTPGGGQALPVQDKWHSQVDKPQALTAYTAIDQGNELTRLLIEVKRLTRKPMMAIGKDTELSGDRFPCACVAGIMSQGRDARLADALSAPCFANLTSGARADAGSVMRAWHDSPFEDNSLEIFDDRGWKLPLPTSPSRAWRARRRTRRLWIPPAPAGAVGRVFPRPGDAEGRAFPVRHAEGRAMVSLLSPFLKGLSPEGISIAASPSCWTARMGRPTGRLPPSSRS
ncbi:MAG: hypothetical protein LBR80_04310 [Deltaproteobacteria bacterium]|nr:hypothetical protein [Deltaproteobacteria bacterium]